MNYNWQLVTEDTLLTDDMGQPVIVTPATRGADIHYQDTGETVPALKRHQTVYKDYREHDIIVGIEHMYIRERASNYALI